jgi:hypothetical protein
MLDQEGSLRLSYIGINVGNIISFLTFISSYQKFPLAPMGVLAPRLSRARLTCPLVPPSTRAEIFRRSCVQSHLQTTHPTSQKSYPKFRNPRTTFQNTPQSAQICHSAGGWWGPPIMFLIGNLIFL